MSGNNDNKIPEDYVSPIVRLAFAREDHPGLGIAYSVVDGEAAGIHPAFRGDAELFVVCTITVPGAPPVTAWKEVPKQESRWSGPQGNRRKVMVTVELNPDMLIVLQTKALGRALKQLGYADNLKSFKAVLLWRQRHREIAVIGAKPVAAAELEAAVAEIPTVSEADEDSDVQDAEVVVTIDEETGEIVVEDDATALWTDLLGSMEPQHRVKCSQWAATTLGVKNIFHVDPDTAEKLLDFYESLDEADGEVRLDA